MTPTNPFDTLQQVAGGYCVARCLHVVADLGVADALNTAPRDARELAADVGADPDALFRILRLLAAHGIFAADGDRFSHSPASSLLRSDHPQSMRAFARMIGLPVNWAIFGDIGYAATTGRPSTEAVVPDGYWHHLETHPEDARVFNGAMEAKAHGQIAGILAHYDFTGFGSIADIGGGRGQLLRAILAASAGTRGVLFDLPPVIAQVGDDIPDRMTLQPGDFFRDELPRCDAYLAMDIIHDWDDAKALAILSAIRRAAPASATLLLLETMISDAAGPDWAKMLDIHMLVLLGGRQRTRDQYISLLTAAGFAFSREIDTHAGISIVEARAA